MDEKNTNINDEGRDMEAEALAGRLRLVPLNAAHVAARARELADMLAGCGDAELAARAVLVAEGTGWLADVTANHHEQMPGL